jgi:hypothetical protein
MFQVSGRQEFLAQTPLGGGLELRGPMAGISPTSEQNGRKCWMLLFLSVALRHLLQKQNGFDFD